MDICAMGFYNIWRLDTANKMLEAHSFIARGSERIAGLDRVLPKRRLLRGFGALTLGGIGGMIVSALGLASRKEKKNPAIMLAGSVLCAVFAGLCWQGYRKR